MRTIARSDVAIVGAGPVGLTLGMELAMRGLEVTLVELRAHAEPPTVKCNHISARSMEIYRRLGVADELRDSGLPPEHPHDCAYRVTVVGMELSRTRIPSRSERLTGDGADSWWPAAELPHRINQIFAEPILTRHASTLPGITILNRHELTGLMQDRDSVRLMVRDHESGEDGAVEASFAVGCDGPRSTVRKLINARLEGPSMVGRVQSTLVRAPSLMSAMQAGPAWCISAWNSRRTGTLIAIDGVERFLIHTALSQDETVDSVDRDWAIRTILGVDEDFELEILSIEDFEGRGLVADSFRLGRVFLAGDAAHLWLPFAGYGMNAGIADAQDLGWLIGAHLAGWLTFAALDAYERERRPVTAQVASHAMGVLPDLLALTRQIPEGIEDPGLQGDEVRVAFGRRAYELNTPQYACAGLNFGYFYDDSPLIAYDGEAPPAYTMGDFTQSTIPGCRLPHLWLADGRSLYDELGPGYSVVRRDPEIDLSTLLASAARRNLPFTVIDIADTTGVEIFDRAVLIVRPDQHIAWRGNSTPDDPDRLLNLLCGAE